MSALNLRGAETKVGDVTDAQPPGSMRDANFGEILWPGFLARLPLAIPRLDQASVLTRAINRK
jgi:hypothetical protein